MNKNTENTEQPHGRHSLDAGVRETELPEPFRADEWHDISLCIGWTLAMAEKTTPEGQARRESARRAMAAMSRVLGETFHARICACLPNDESSDLRTVSALESEQREPQVRCDDWLGERKRRSRPGVEREAGAEPGETNL